MIEIKSLTASVTEYLRNQIIAGSFPAGQRLNETELAARLDVSRPPLREAFRVLEHEHLIVSIPRKGTYVSTISVDDLENLYTIREMLECYAITLLAADKVREVPAMKSALSLAESLPIPNNQDPEEILHYLEVFARFHLTLMEATGNPWMIHFYNSISSHLARYQYLYLNVPGSRQGSLAEHERFVTLLTTGSYEQAGKQMAKHIRTAFARTREKMIKEGIGQQPQKDPHKG